MSHLTRGAWIEIKINLVATWQPRVAPHTRCVDWNFILKVIEVYKCLSHLTRGAWIEIVARWLLLIASVRRTSHEVRGLKLKWFCNFFVHVWSHLTRGAWIEMMYWLNICRLDSVAPHTRCVDWNSNELNVVLFHSCRTSHEVRGLKFLLLVPFLEYVGSHLTRGAWIEILFRWNRRHLVMVAPHTRYVDWNCPCLSSLAFACCRTSHEVRGLKSRNFKFWIFPFEVAPHTRCVDWNKFPQSSPPDFQKSHLTRGAWIEISKIGISDVTLQSHLTRGAWIEIISLLRRSLCPIGRTSHEVRGLKYSKIVGWVSAVRRTSHEVRGLKL